jgi:phage-related baseplate assembly protein
MTVHIKGTPVNGLLDFVRSELSAEQISAVIAKMPEEEQKYWKSHVLAHALVPLEAANRFTHAAAEAKGEPVKSFAKRAGRFGAEIGLKTVYKFVLMVMSVEGVLKKAPFMWTRVYDGGKIDVQSTTNAATITITEFPSDVAVCGRITGWFELIGERTGAKNIKLTHKPCAAEGGDRCTWNFTWQ